MRRLVRLARAASHPGTAVVFDARMGIRLAQVAITRVEQLLGHRKEAFYFADVEADGVKLREEVSKEDVEGAV